ncbi:MAG: glycerate kinase [Rhodobacteraceae bacterium]|nr:MAG: glycerate kinase [Paracoccaceae bacterium]
MDHIKFLRNLFQAAVAAADPMKTIPRALGEKPEGRVVVVGAGKASARMAEAVESLWGPCEGLVITRYGYARPTQSIEIVEAAHPVPDQAALEATDRMLSLLSGLGEEDFVLALISGGGSSLLCAPSEGISLGDMQIVHQALLKSGAPIQKMNTVRKHISRIKGGQLAAAAHPATMLSLMISDVAGDDPSDIASGVTVGENTTSQSALSIIDDYEIELPTSVMVVLKQGSSVISPSDRRLETVRNQIISAPSQSLEAARDALGDMDVDCRILGDAIEGEAREEAVRQVELALEVQSRMISGDRPVLLLSGGECTVSGWGGGIGGPNAEFALAAAIALDGGVGIHLLACDTDGVDGAAEVAGAVVHPGTLLLAAEMGLDPNAYLERNDSHRFFEQIGGQVVTGPTLTNVNDFRAILIEAKG